MAAAAATPLAALRRHLPMRGEEWRRPPPRGGGCRGPRAGAGLTAGRSGSCHTALVDTDRTGNGGRRCRRQCRSPPAARQLPRPPSPVAAHRRYRRRSPHSCCLYRLEKNWPQGGGRSHGHRRAPAGTPRRPHRTIPPPQSSPPPVPLVNPHSTSARKLVNLGGRRVRDVTFRCRPPLRQHTSLSPPPPTRGRRPRRHAAMHEPHSPTTCHVPGAAATGDGPARQPPARISSWHSRLAHQRPT